MKQIMIIGLAAWMAVGVLGGAGCRQEEPPPMPGGWERAAPRDEHVQAAARFAVAAQAERSGEPLALLEVRQARTQVVAGTNLSLDLRVSRNGTPAQASATVWSKLDGSYDLTDWHWVD